jgi:hypothetical protein
VAISRDARCVLLELRCHVTDLERADSLKTGTCGGQTSRIMRTRSLLTLIIGWILCSPLAHAITFPVVASVSPASGGAGTAVTITAAQSFNSFAFGTVAAVSFGGVNATSFTVNDPNAVTITAIAPAGTGTVDITVTTNLPGFGLIVSPTSAADQFTYPASSATPVPALSFPALAGLALLLMGAGAIILRRRHGNT